MKLPWQKDADDAASSTSDVSLEKESTPDSDDSTAKGSAYTAAKGRPTPKRRDAQNKRSGPLAPPPTTRAEARARRKELRSTQTKEQKREANANRRAQRIEQRERMMEGDEKFLMPRDKGPVRRYVRDIVDSRRNFAGLFMPFAIVLILVMFIPTLTPFATPVMLVFVLFMAIDGVVLGRLVNKRVRERFPDATDTGFRLGWYALTRAMQLRKMRAPKPKAVVGEKV
ncbi:hypothetical protein GOEFS_009_00320 [Gordonia effusa NBRC 100432]|uniref:DUF3043 domain-containing protein n=1 Tax=Gordonia effusa NBRC 100432 TaxID=1077974 RepID=H0QV13_9ACTN|nr:DUF3043 domain-containing protein [Gordonia effusa]GAB16664.1 hypothetical protein GOEFS_009_00320 [Gordonia effusa NBRC 100432]